VGGRRLGSAISSSDRAGPPKTRERPRDVLKPRYANTKSWADLVAAALRWVPPRGPPGEIADPNRLALLCLAAERESVAAAMRCEHYVAQLTSFQQNGLRTCDPCELAVDVARAASTFQLGSRCPLCFVVPSMQGDSCCQQSLVRGLQARNLAPGVSRKTEHILRLRGALARRIRLTRDWNITCSLPASRSAPSSVKHPKLEWSISPLHAPAVHVDGSHTEVRG